MTSACMSGLPSPGLVIWMRNPFEPSDRQVSHVFGSPTIAQWMNRDGIELNQPTLILKNGQPVLMAHRAVTPIDAGDVVALVTLPQGGGGGGKNPLRTVLMIAVLVVANAYGGALAASMGYSGTLATAVASTAIAVTGSVLVNALVPLPNQSLPSASANTTSPSPTYSLQARGNYGRLAQPVPVIYGRHLVYPDLATMPYTEYENNEEYLHQLHVIGVGHFQFEELSIDDSPISSFAEVQAQVIEPGGQNTLFNPDVVTAPEVSGQELIAVTDAGSIVGPFALNPVGTLINQIGVDVVMLRGLYYANDSGALESRSVQWRVEVRSINDDGDATSGWLHVADETYSAATNTAQRLPKFRQQIRDGGPITLTHPEITRYFMTIPEAAQLVIQAGAMAKGGEVFVLGMGESVKIMDLARRMVELSGLTVRDEQHPNGDIEIEITGLRPGEKLYEELLIGDNPKPTSHLRIMKAHEDFMAWAELESKLRTLELALSVNDVGVIRAVIVQLVPGYTPSDEIVDWVFMEQEAEADRLGLAN